ncbi:ribonuclease hi [Plakobranchus ocellatus]|uniref:Ribonuclease hi n=1 Tax=Plakobranchus ocellatus TaxID=259542 RepID=A0AAV4AZ76_9GAST|nr:ribonuclease hi [Plakobranchus ocellatus]
MVMCRLRVGHTWLTNSYLLKNEEQPFCYACDSLYTVRHILIECPDFQVTRRKYFSVTDMYRLFREVNPSRIAVICKEKDKLKQMLRQQATRILETNTLIRFFNINIKSALLYGSEIWRLHKGTTNKLLEEDRRNPLLRH